MRHPPVVLNQLVGSAANAAGYVTTAQLLLAGASRYQLKRATTLGLLRPVAPGLHLVDGSQTAGPWLDRVGRALAQAGPGAAAARHTAARLLEIAGSPAALPIELVVPQARRPAKRPGVAATRAEVPACDLTSSNGLSLTSPLRTLLDCGRFGDHVSAVALMESAIRARLVCPADILERFDLLRRAPGIARARLALERADTLSESPLETALRLVLLDGGLPRPELQVAFSHEGRRGRIDLAYRAVDLRGAGGRYVGLAIEADGRTFHDDADAIHLDRTRQTALEEAGWLVRRFTDRHVRRRPAYVVTTVSRALALVIAG